jgi:nitroreductase
VDAIEVMLSRRSTRRWGEGEVSEDALEIVLACGSAAPSSKNARPWTLHPVVDRALLESVGNAMAADERAAQYVPVDPATGLPLSAYESTVLASAEVIRQSQCGVFIENRSPFPGGRSRLALSKGSALSAALVGYGFEMIGIGAAIENMWLAAHALGLGAVFIGDVLIAEEHVRKMLSLTGDLAGVIALGVPA